MNRQRYLQVRDSVDLTPDSKILINTGLQTLLLIGASAFISIHFAGSAARFLAIPLISVLMFRSFALMHEAVHGLLCKDNQLNNLLGIISGTLCFLSFDSW